MLEAGGAEACVEAGADDCTTGSVEGGAEVVCVIAGGLVAGGVWPEEPEAADVAVCLSRTASAVSQMRARTTTTAANSTSRRRQ